MKIKWLTLGAVFFVAIGAAVWPSGTSHAAPNARDCNGVAVSISSPAPGSEVSGQFPIIGSAWLPGDEFRYYKVEFSAAGANTWAVVVDGVRTPVSNGTLAVMNADLLPEGDYTIRLLAIDYTANYCEAFASPVHVTHNPVTTPTPEATGTPDAALTAAAQKITATAIALPTPTLVLEVPTIIPGTDSLLSKGKSAAFGLPVLPTEFSSLGTTVGGWLGAFGRAFFFGAQLTASAFILLGVIAFLRRNL